MNELVCIYNIIKKNKITGENEAYINFGVAHNFLNKNNNCPYFEEFKIKIKIHNFLFFKSTEKISNRRKFHYFYNGRKLLLEKAIKDIETSKNKNIYCNKCKKYTSLDKSTIPTND